MRQKGKAKANPTETQTEMQTETQTETQSTDVTMIDALGSEATIPVDESQATTDDQDAKWETGSVDWDETQLVETQEDEVAS